MSIGMKSALAAVALATLGLSASSASAMPVGLDSAVVTSATSAQIDNVRWVCGPYRCFWRPNYWGGPRWRPHRRWRRW